MTMTTTSRKLAIRGKGFVSLTVANDGRQTAMNEMNKCTTKIHYNCCISEDFLSSFLLTTTTITTTTTTTTLHYFIIRVNGPHINTIRGTWNSYI